jgi:hypothetical protein
LRYRKIGYSMKYGAGIWNRTAPGKVKSGYGVPLPDSR